MEKTKPRFEDVLAKDQVNRVAEEVSVFTAVPVKEIFGKARTKSVMRAKRLTYYLSHIVFDMSYSAISKAFDHHSYSAEEKGIKQMEVWVKHYPAVYSIVEELMIRLKPERAKYRLPSLFNRDLEK